MRYRKGYTNVLVGQCREFPFIVIEGKTVEELRAKMTYELEAYFNTFPEQGKKATEMYGKPIEEGVQTVTQQQQEEGWDQKPILAPITIK
jgi:predicted RNase H-like HicB family nuclease